MASRSRIGPLKGSARRIRTRNSSPSSAMAVEVVLGHGREWVYEASLVLRMLFQGPLLLEA